MKSRIGDALQIGDRVKIIIDQIDPDMHLHGRKATITDIEFDDAGSVTGNSEDNFIYTLKLENGETPDIHFRRNDLQPID